MRRIPGVELEPVPHANGEIGPYAHSDLRSIVTSRVRPLPWKWWYTENRDLMTSQEAPVVTGAHPQLEQWLRAVDGLDPRMAIEQLPVSEWPLSRVIPNVIPSKTDWPPFSIPTGTYWVDYQRISKSHRNLPDREWTYDITGRFPQGSRVILGFVGDHLIPRLLWRHRHDLWSNPFFEQFKGGFCSPDFSSWMTDPKVQSLIGERMTQQFVTLGYEHGYNMIPYIGWQDRDHLRRQADMLGGLYPKVNTIVIFMVSSGVDKTSWLYSHLDDIREFLGHLPFRFILTGVEAGASIHAVRDALPNDRFHVVASAPYLTASQSFGSAKQREIIFREKIAQKEEFHRGIDLPPMRPRPEDPYADLMGEDRVSSPSDPTLG